MKYTSDINKIQAQIISSLFSSQSMKFSALNTGNLPSDQFSYHIRRLTKYNIIEKDEQGNYRLSVDGRSLAIRLSNPKNEFIEQGFIACRIILSRQHNNQIEYLMQQRKRVPFFDHISEPGGKILYGEEISESARRNLYAETGLTCNLTVKGVAHFRDRYEDRVVQDKFFFIISATNPKGDLLSEGPTGVNIWMTLNEISTNPKVLPGVLDMIHTANDTKHWLIEQSHTATNY